MKTFRNLLTFLAVLLFASLGYGQNTGCPIPVAQSATNITNSSASINWTVQSSTPNPSLVMRYRVANTATWTNGIPSSKPVVLSGLNAATTYEWQIAQVCSTSTGTAVTSGYSNVIVFTTTNQSASCTVPTGLLADSITASTARLSWTAVSGAIGYNVRYRPSGSTTWFSVSSQGNVRFVNNLLGSTTYEWQVQTVCGSAAGTASTSAFSPSQTFTTLAPAPCNTPTGLLTDSITSTSARVSWTPVSGAFGYNVRFRVAGTSTWTTVGSAGNARVLINLLPATNYEWQVQTLCGSATNAGSASAYSASVTFTTLAAQACPVPTGQLTDSITASSARVSWSAVSGAQGYSVRYRRTATTTWTVVSSPTNSRFLTALLASTAYEWQVQSICSPNTVSGASLWSASITFTTLAPPPCTTPSNLSSSNITAGSATLSWSNTGAIDYGVRYRVNGSTSWVTATSTTNSRIVSGLLASTNYEWQVRSRCVSSSTTASYSNWSASAFFTTLAPTPCVTPTGLTADSISNSGVRLTWNAVVGVSAYQVSYRRVGTSTWTFVSSQTTIRFIGNLLPSSAYEARVRSVCPSASTNTPNYSAWSPSITFTTLPPTMVYPNPASDQLNIQWSEELQGTVNFKIYDFTGNSVLRQSQAVNPGETSGFLDVSGLKNGLYYLEVDKGNTIERVPFVIKH